MKHLQLDKNDKNSQLSELSAVKERGREGAMFVLISIKSDGGGTSIVISPRHRPY